MYQTSARHWNTAPMTRQPRAVSLDRGLAPARGVLIGVSLGAVLWAGIISAIARILG